MNVNIYFCVGKDYADTLIETFGSEGLKPVWKTNVYFTLSSAGLHMNFYISEDIVDGTIYMIRKGEVNEKSARTN